MKVAIIGASYAGLSAYHALKQVARRPTQVKIFDKAEPGFARPRGIGIWPKVRYESFLLTFCYLSV